MKPGLHHDIDAGVYHRDELCDEPSLSSSVAKILLKDTPRHAWFAHPRLNPNFKPDEDDKFNLGSVAHELILGKGGGFDVHDFEDWRTKDARAAKVLSRSKGHTPVLRHQFARAAMVKESVLPRRPTDWLEGASEVVAIWQDIGGALCRAMFDRLTPSGIIFDVKCTDAGLSDAQIAKQIVNMGYDLSAAFYVRGLAQLKPEFAGRIKFYWLMVEISEPFECRLIEADATTLTIGDRKAALAIAKWRRCLETNSWPGYSTTIATITYPAWAESAWMEREITDDDTLTWKPLDGGSGLARIARDLRMAG